MIILLRREQSTIKHLWPYLEASGAFTFAKFEENRIPMGELWIDASIDYFNPPSTIELYRFFAEVHTVIEQWKASKVRLLLSTPYETGEQTIKKTVTLVEGMTQIYQKIYGVLPLYLPELLESNSQHPASQILASFHHKQPLSLLWGEGSQISLLPARYCAEHLLEELPNSPCRIEGISCTLKHLEEKSTIFWSGLPVLYENAYSLVPCVQATSIGVESEPLESFLMNLV
ncbi:MAG: hypothetical protein ACRCY4_06970 [Brevinema sp.]